MTTVFLTHTPDMLANYYGERALAALRKLAAVKFNETGKVLDDPRALAEAARGCAIIVSDRQTPGPAAFFPLAPDLVAFLRVAVDIRNIDVAAASAQGILVTHATMENSVRKAVDAIKAESYLVGEPQVIRIERPKDM